ncbi:MAG: tripartite tricarboxylate transporter substrate binding protein [Betaproteobacteria bacterium]|nr:tripartite tricarboxylate transporter substrate binding protein [Betaproteobacteria bacterium]MBI2960971.1 tripartite tricarboxylate transporter substrate binding protein [Betaproteobacteria bacterium]
MVKGIRGDVIGNKTSRLVALAGALLASLWFCPGGALAQGYPEKPIKIVVAWPAGGNTDTLSRLVAQRLAEKLSQPVIVENRPGASGAIGGEAVARAPADGYTLLVVDSSTYLIQLVSSRKFAYEAVADFALIAPFARNSFLLLGRADLPAKSARELIELARAKPGKLTFGSWGIGSIGQIAMVMFTGNAGIEVLHVPFQGGAPAETALLGGQIDLMLLPVGRVLALKKTGKIRVFAAMSAARSPLMDDIPTLKEEGFEAAEAGNWFGLAAPVKTPQPVVQRLAGDIGAVVKSPAIQAAFRSQGWDAFSLPQEAFKRFVGAEVARWSEVIRRENIRVE